MAERKIDDSVPVTLAQIMVEIGVTFERYVTKLADEGHNDSSLINF